MCSNDPNHKHDIPGFQADYSLGGINYNNPVVQRANLISSYSGSRMHINRSYL